MSHSVTTSPSIQQAYGVRRRRSWLALGILLLVVVILALISLSVGSSRMSLASVLQALFGQGDAYGRIVVWNLRMPRILTALVGGVALALAGCVFQSVLRNPLASASTLGIAQGAAFGASVAIICLGALGGAVEASSTVMSASATAYEGVSSGNPYLTALCAFIGGGLSMLVILAFSRIKALTPEAIVLAGVALAALFSGVTAIIQYFAEDSQVAAVVFWTFGDLGRVGYKELAIMTVVTVVAALFFFFNRWNYNAMESGEVSAHGLGLNVQRMRLVSMSVATLAAACVIAFCGTINFIGLVAPHIMRRVVGDDYRFLLPASALAGGGILLLADLIARVVISGVVLPISAITAFVGAPVFLWLLFKGVHR